LIYLFLLHVVADESAICRDALMRNKGWAPQGKRTERVPRRNDATRLSLLPAVSLDGILGMIAQPGSIQRPDFEFFLEQVLVSHLTTAVPMWVFKLLINLLGHASFQR
jgi:hypothetical protein